jgi:hypothetical protein
MVQRFSIYVQSGKIHCSTLENLAMKISNILILPCMLALALSLSSFTADKKERSRQEKTSKSFSFDAYLFNVPHSNTVKLIIDRENVAKLWIVLSGKDGKIYYSEVFNENQAKYRRAFHMDELNEGTYYFEVYSKKQKLVKEVKIYSASEKLISFL